MLQVTARLPDALGAELDAAAQQLNRCRADIIRQAIEYYLDDIEDLRCGCWSLSNSRSAAKALAALPKADRMQVVEAIDLLCDTPAAGPTTSSVGSPVGRLPGVTPMDCCMNDLQLYGVSQ